MRDRQTRPHFVATAADVNELMPLFTKGAASGDFDAGVRAALQGMLSSLHFMPSLDPQVLTCMSLFGDAAAALMLTDDPTADGPELVDTSLPDQRSRTRCHAP